MVTDISQHDDSVLVLLAFAFIADPVQQHFIGMFESVDDGSASLSMNFIQPFIDLWTDVFLQGAVKYRCCVVIKNYHSNRIVGL